MNENEMTLSEAASMILTMAEKWYIQVATDPGNNPERVDASDVVIAALEKLGADVSGMGTTLDEVRKDLAG